MPKVNLCLLSVYNVLAEAVAVTVQHTWGQLFNGSSHPFEEIVQPVKVAHDIFNSLKPLFNRDSTTLCHFMMIIWYHLKD